jgi:hypothetical protein
MQFPQLANGRVRHGKVSDILWDIDIQSSLQIAALNKPERAEFIAHMKNWLENYDAWCRQPVD